MQEFATGHFHGMAPPAISAKFSLICYVAASLINHFEPRAGQEITAVR
jgi:hypothetical protein